MNAISISTSGAYITKISSFDLVNYVTFTAQAALFENGGSLTMAGAFVDSGLVSLNEANTTGTVGVTGDVLAFGNTAPWAPARAH